MDTILVATDLSERSDPAIQRALQLARQHDAKCHVVSVVDDAMPLDITNDLADKITERLIDLVNGNAGKAETEVTVLRGRVAEMLTMFAALHDADLMVLGLHRPRAFLDGYRETTMERLVTTSRVPVLLVVGDASQPYDSALVPVSFSSSCVGAIKGVKQIAPEAEVSSFHALQTPYAGARNGEEMDRMLQEETRAARGEWRAGAGLDDSIAETEIVSGLVGQVLSEKLMILEPSILAIGAHTRSGLALHRLGGFAAELVRQPPVDLLVAPPPRR